SARAGVLLAPTGNGPGRGTRSRADRDNRARLRACCAPPGPGEIRWRYLPSSCRTCSTSPRTGRLDADGLLGFGQYAAQYVHLDQIGVGPPKQPAQARHQLAGVLGVKGADL